MASIDARSPIWIASAVLAELEVGCWLCEAEERSQAQDEIRRTLVANNINILEFTNHTAEKYGELKARLAIKYNRKQTGKWKLKWPEAWSGPVHGQLLGVDEFDLIMVSHALERNLRLITTDGMERICEGLDLPRNMFDNWITVTPEAMRADHPDR